MSEDTVSRWRQHRSIGERFNIHEQIAAAHAAAADERAFEVYMAREHVRALLLEHQLPMASFAVRSDGELQRPYMEFTRMAQRMRSGGYHKARLLAGGSLDG
jgi:hypothetical protein